jgi:hypothetical protein
MPGAFLHSIDIAIDKAYTAASFGLPTSQWHAALQAHSDAVREGIVRRPVLWLLAAACHSTRPVSALAASVSRAVRRRRMKPARKPG